MAEAGYGCVFGDCPKQFAHMITNITNGATVTLCDDHYAPGLIPLLAAELGVDPGDFYATVERYIKRQQAKADKDLADAQAATAVKGSQAPAASPDDHQAPGNDDDDDHQADDHQAATVGGDAA